MVSASTSREQAEVAADRVQWMTLRGPLYCCMTSHLAQILVSRCGIDGALLTGCKLSHSGLQFACVLPQQGYRVTSPAKGCCSALVVLQEQARVYCDSLRTNPDIWQLCMQRFGSSGYAEVQFWCLQTLQQVSWPALSLTVCRPYFTLTTALNVMTLHVTALCEALQQYLSHALLSSRVVDSTLLVAEP